MFKGLFKKGEEEKDKKKQIENIIVCIVILIITVLIINSMWSTDNKESQNKYKAKFKSTCPNNFNRYKYRRTRQFREKIGGDFSKY